MKLMPPYWTMDTGEDERRKWVSGTSGRHVGLGLEELYICGTTPGYARPFVSRIRPVY
jgi:hypothetical protein